MLVRYRSSAAMAVLATGVLMGGDSGVTIESRMKKGEADRVARPQLRVESNLVLIPVSVTDPLNRPVTGLEKDNFRVFEDKVEQQVLHISAEDTPVAVGLLFDTSGSMHYKLGYAREAAAQFFGTSNREDEFFLIEFSDRARLVEPLTPSAETIRERLTHTRAKGRTALLDAICLGLHELKKSSKPRKALLIISDGGDNCSRYTESEVRNMVRESDVTIYSVGIFESGFRRGRALEEFNGPHLLKDVSELTGGRMFPLTDVAELPDVAEKIGLELRNSYVLAYSPRNLHRDGRYRKVQVKFVAPRGVAAARVASRPGYYAPVE